MPERQQQSRLERFERLRQLAEQNAVAGLNEAKALALVEQAREEVYQIKRQKSANT